MGEIIKGLGMLLGYGLYKSKIEDEGLKKLNNLHELGCQVARNFNQQSREEALLKYGDQPLGEVYQQTIDGPLIYTVTREEWLNMYCHPDSKYRARTLADAKGWNSAWGNKKEEMALMTRIYTAYKYKNRFKEILDQPLSNFYLPERTYQISVPDKNWPTGYRTVYTTSQEEYEKWKERVEKQKEQDKQISIIFVGALIIVVIVILGCLFGP